MAVFDRNVSCEDVEVYYHDFILDPDDPSVPVFVTEHLRHCPHCLGQIDRLRKILDQSVDGCADMDLVAELQRHFELLGDRVDCHHVKAILPTLLDSSLRIRIPTPVTVHIDHCQECAQDLEALKCLGLESAQLARLRRLYAEAPEVCTVSESCMAVHVEHLGSVSLAGLEGESAKHCCLCPRCRDEIYERRQALLERLGSAQGRGTCSRDLSMTEIFDYAVPYGRSDDASDDLGEHLRSCPVCLEKLQLLHSTVYGVLERTDSPIATVYTARASEPAEAVLSTDPYASHSIEVQVSGTEDRTESIPTGVRWVSSPTVKATFLAAALIPLAIIFWLSLPSASGLSVGQIVDMVASAPAVHVQRYDSLMGPESPLMEVWMTPETVVVATPPKRMVYDLERNRKLEVGLGLASPQWNVLDRNEIARVRSTIDSLFQFPNKNGQLQRIDSESNTAIPEDTEVWELAWEDPASSGASILRRWRVSIDPLTRRPEKIEYDEEFRGEEIVTTTYLSYPSSTEVQEYLETLKLP